MEEAWAIAIHRGAPGGRGALVAVLDSGVAYERRGRYRRAPDLRRSTFLRATTSWGTTGTPMTCSGTAPTWRAPSPSPPTTDRHRRHRLSRTDHAPAGARLEGLRRLGGDRARVRYAARHGADVINLSLEFPTGVRACGDPGRARRAALRAQKGVTVVAAAGNQADGAVAYPARASS